MLSLTIHNCSVITSHLMVQYKNDQVKCKIRKDVIYPCSVGRESGESFLGHT